MKLHLPHNLLAVALFSACATTTLATTINVGRADDSNDYYNNLYTHDATNTQKLLTVGDDDKIGYFIGDTFVTSFGDASPDGKNLESEIVSNSLSVVESGKVWFIPYTKDANVLIKGNGQIYLGGKNGKNQFAGLTAYDVTLDASATGTQEDGMANLWVDAITANKLIINGGTAYIRTSYAGGNSTAGNGYTLDGLTYIDSVKSATLFSGLYMHGGYLKMGRQSNGDTVGAGDRNKTNEHFVNIINGALEQTNGTAEILGKTYIGASKVSQSGGTMKLAYDPTAGYEYLRFGNSSTTIEQNSASADTKLDIEGKIIFGDNGNGAMKLNIKQLGLGTLSLENGVMFTTANDDAKNASSISQTGAGTINLAGDYTSALFNISQSGGGTVNVNGEMRANTVDVSSTSTLNINTDVTANSITQSGTSNVNINGSMSAGSVALNGGTMIVADGATLTANTITINGGTLVNGYVEPVATLDVEGDINSLSDTMSMLSTVETGGIKGNVVVNSGEYIEYGNLEGSLTIDGGQVTLNEDANVGAIVVNGGKLAVAGDATTGSITVTSGTIEFDSSTQLTLVENATISIADGVKVVVKMSAEDLVKLNNGEDVSITLFDSSTSTLEFDNTLITFTDGEQSVDKTVTGSATGGTVTVTGSIPEPTTATLSLLALAALAARRRRK